MPHDAQSIVEESQLRQMHVRDMTAMLAAD